MLAEVWLLPPLGIARLGPSPIPCPNFQWGPNDVGPRGTGKTTILPAETLHVAQDGTITAGVPEAVSFRDEVGIRPVCTFFELHGRWTEGGQEATGPITVSLLNQAGISIGDVTWTVDVANMKAYHMTLVDGDKIAAHLELRGDETTRRPLMGHSPPDAPQPLVHDDVPLPLGSVQVTKTTADFPELRLLFTPAAGHVYAPTDLDERSMEYPIPGEHRILNPAAQWAGFSLVEDPRTNPGGLFATDDQGRSLGFIDDVCDGLVRCAVPGLPPARARVAVGPPRYAPDRRPIVSLADGFTDRVKRLDVSDPAFVEDFESTTHEVRDLMERVWETMALVNVDFQNERARAENRGVAASMGLPPEAAADKAFKRPDAIAERPLPLTEIGRLQHHRLLSLEVFEDMLRERPDLIDRVIRPPGTSDNYYDRRMPALFRGSDRHPMHLTRRQYDLLRAWAARLRRDSEEGTFT
jgi:hypothetical protein